MWTEKYRPRTVGEVVGNEGAKKEFVNWILGLRGKRRGKRSKKMGAFLVGPPGTGKTALVYAAANQFGFRVFELNASDVRTKGRLEDALRQVPKTRPLDPYIGVEKFEVMVFLDEVDGIHGTADRGGLSTLLNLARQGEMTMVLSANFPDPAKHRDLLKGFKVIRLWPLTTRQLVVLLKRIARAEGLSIGDEVVEDIAVKSRGDARLAVNMLQISATGGAVEGVVETLPLQETINTVLREEDEERVLALISASLSTPQDVYRGLAEAVASSSLDVETRSRALDLLSRMDVHMGRIRRTGEWKMLRELMYMLAGVFSILRGSGILYVNKIPDYVLYRAIKASRRERTMEAAKKVGRRLHLSARKAVFEVLPFLSLDVKRGSRELSRGMGLDERDEEILAKIEL
ncbi:MAG: AAA family ATPase [Candidatus Geothermarchaeales archaeon]